MKECHYKDRDWHERRLSSRWKGAPISKSDFKTLHGWAGRRTATETETTEKEIDQVTSQGITMELKGMVGNFTREGILLGQLQEKAKKNKLN